MSIEVADLPGVFISFEGGEGAGKTTHINFLADALRSQGREVVCLREPGGTHIGEALRAVVLDTANANLCPAAELLIFEASRAQIVHELIKPALERGAVVLCDRFFDSTTAYQGYGRGLSLDFIHHANLFASQGAVPSRTVLMKVPGQAECGLERATRGVGADRMESAGLDFHTRVNAAFERIAAEEPERVRIVYSADCKAKTAKRVFCAVADVLGWDPEHLPFDDEFFKKAKNYHGKRPKEGRSA